ncbi:SusC/RagA family TonB-linked outer membrane protein [Pedobacter sp. WC2423]|uniref:SusC/RagA family TonB-linked outer membrane protein n=1 Tax=Pedobacter sp. WC2423 TaxID=3234142 RepID=UPI003465A779
MYKIYTKKDGVLNRHISKLLLIMRLTTLILIATIMQLSATGYSQRISLNIKNAPLNNVIKEISRQSGYEFFYNNDLIEKTSPITINIRNSSLEEALIKCFINQPFTFEIRNKAVSLKPKSPSIIKSLNKALSELFTEIDIRGHVVDNNNLPLVGTTVKVLNSNKAVLTNNEGYFELLNVDEKAILIVSYIGYKSQQIPAQQSGPLIIKLELQPSDLEGVEIVSTGYQTLPKERTTGSFEKIDNNLFNRVTGTTVTSRLLGTVAGVYFNNRSATSPTGDAISIRGISSLNNNTILTRPLVVLDNIPYEGDLSNLNPNDVENITILKDAAAASIWGTRAGNGVIVITTKKGAYDKPLSISFNGNVTISEKPDLFYLPQISSSDAIDVERFLFANQYYDNKLTTTSPYPPFLTPVVELLAKQRELPLSDTEGRALIDNQINAFRQYDVRNDYLKYMYRDAINQQYSLNINGGSKQVTYMLSAGYDRNLNSLVTSTYNRTSFRSNVTFKPIKQLDIQTSFLYTRTKDVNSDEAAAGATSYDPGLFYPYARLADGSGNHLAPGMIYNPTYLDNLSKDSRLVDWRFKPLDDLHKTVFTGNSQDILFNLGVTYNLNSILSADIKYQYQQTNTDSKTLYDKDSYYVRNLVNTYTDPITFERAIPSGAINIPRESIFKAQTIRAQVNGHKIWNNKHELNAIAGAEARKNYGLTTIQNTLYGFDPNTNSFLNVDYKNPVQTYYGGTELIPNQPSINDNNNRFTSLFFNSAYTYNNRYSISASVRKDASNVFGDNANKRGSPLWSGGASWDISKENFYRFEFIPNLKLRGTYGYSGNVVTGVPAYAVVTYPGSNSITGLPYAQTTNPPNPDLRWEKVGMLNIGLDFSMKNNRLTGSIEYFDKRSKDLVTNAPIDLTKGSYTQTLNSANLHGKGIDITLNSLNMNMSDFQWRSTLIFNYSRTIVTRYLLKENTALDYIGRSNFLNPIEGKDAYAVLAYNWAGLDSSNGEPQGYLNGEVSKDYSNLLNAKIEDLRYFGSATPVYYGAFRNTFSFKGIEVSANILYKFDYYFKRPGINYNNLYAIGMGNEEYSRRWQKQGDEKITDIPAMIYPPNSERDDFYNGSAATVEKADHIRLQDITVAYLLQNRIPGLKSVRLYANVNNVGILWRANKKGIDPDIISGYRSPRTFSMGLTANF